MSVRASLWSVLVYSSVTFTAHAAETVVASAPTPAPAVTPAAGASTEIQGVTVEMVEAAKRLWNALNDDQKAKAGYEMNNAERQNWNFVPMPRKGLPMKEMTPAQRVLALGFFNTAMSPRGFMDATTTMSMEQVLYDMENKSPKRDPEMYYILIFGKPDVAGSWGWRLEGHHLSLNFSVVDGKFVGFGPGFWGSNPGEVREGPRKGLKISAGEEAMGCALVLSLTEEQRKTAIIDVTAPKEVITGTSHKVDIGAPTGLAVAQMDETQKTALATLIKHVICRYRLELSHQDWDRIEKAGFDKVKFSWAGSTEVGQGHYYRIHGPTFLIEYDNTQNNANHIHVVYRDLENDFGGDLLRKHYEENPNDHGDVKP